MPKTTNLALKTAIVATGQLQHRVARRARIHPQRLSNAIHGRKILNDKERERLSKILGQSEAELFAPAVAS